MKFIHTDIDKTVLPKTKGKKVGDYRFYDIDGKLSVCYFSIEHEKTEGLKNGVSQLGRCCQLIEMRRCANRVNLYTH